jgi:hypothetical protein
MVPSRVQNLNAFVDPDSESGSMGKKNEEKNALFLNFLNIFIAKR